MRNPLLYKLGMEGKCFGKMEMTKWILYALWHALVIYYICFFCITEADSMNSPKQPDGQDLGFWVGGHVVYGACCIIANAVLAHKFHHHHWGGVGLLSMMVLSFFVIIAI
jgi:hypothetical protein